MQDISSRRPSNSRSEPWQRPKIVLLNAVPVRADKLVTVYYHDMYGLPLLPVPRRRLDDCAVRLPRFQFLDHVRTGLLKGMANCRAKIFVHSHFGDPVSVSGVANSRDEEISPSHSIRRSPHLL